MKLYTGKILRWFITLQTVLYVAFLILDLYGNKGHISSYIKYTIIILCFCYTLLPSVGANRSILFYTRIALFFTVISDYFLLISDYYFYGVLTFVLAQQFYGIGIDLSVYPLSTYRKGSRSRRFLLRFLIQLGITIAVCLMLRQYQVQLDKLLIVSIFYFLSIVTNTIRAVRISFRRREDTGLVLYTIGMVLFLLCDINVGLFNLSGFVTIPKELYETIYSLSSILMWTFYAPSQVLISISAHKRQ